MKKDFQIQSILPQPNSQRGHWVCLNYNLVQFHSLLLDPCPLQIHVVVLICSQFSSEMNQSSWRDKISNSCWDGQLWEPLPEGDVEEATLGFSLSTSHSPLKPSTRLCIIKHALIPQLSSHGSHFPFHAKKTQLCQAVTQSSLFLTL